MQIRVVSAWLFLRSTLLSGKWKIPLLLLLQRNARIRSLGAADEINISGLSENQLKV